MVHQSRILSQAKMRIYEPMSQVLDTIADEVDEDSPKIYDDIAPATQHEESQHKLQDAKLSKSFAFFLP